MPCHSCHTHMIPLIRDEGQHSAAGIVFKNCTKCTFCHLHMAWSQAEPLSRQLDCQCAGQGLTVYDRPSWSAYGIYFAFSGQ